MENDLGQIEFLILERTDPVLEAPTCGMWSGEGLSRRGLGSSHTIKEKTNETNLLKLKNTLLRIAPLII
jgi:hypothetical protein